MPQDNWRWCSTCDGLCFAGNAQHRGPSVGRCYFQHVGQDNYHHRVFQWGSRSPLYVLHREGEGIGQVGWRWCHECEGLWFAGNRVGGRCFAGGDGHVHAGSYPYVVPYESQPEGRPHGQAGWRWCRNCQGLWFMAHNAQGRCPAGGAHIETGSGRYVLENLPSELAWFDALSGTEVTAYGVSVWHDRRVTGSEPGLKAATSDSGLWPLLSNPGRPAVLFGDDLGGFPRRGLPTAVALGQTPYAAIVVVQRTSARGDNYPLASPGVDCNVLGCAENSVLHLGWQSERNIRFGQWANDVDLGNVPAFRSVVSIISALADGRRNLVALDEPGFSQVSPPRPNTTLLRDGPHVSIGGPPRNTGWDFHFNGHVFEVVLWNQVLSPRQLDLKRAVLREKYGVDGAAMVPTP